MRTVNVVVCGDIHPSGMALLRDAVDVEVVVVDPLDQAAVADRLPSASALLIRTMSLRGDLINRATKLKVVSRYGVGFDNIDVDALTLRRIPLAVVGQANARSVAEHTLHMMLAAAKAGPAYDRAVRSGDWHYRDSFEATELAGKGLLIVGMGRIGSLVGELAEAFGMTIWFYDPDPKAKTIGAAWHHVRELFVGLAGADFVTVHTPLTDTTRLLIGEAGLGVMKNSAILVSTARGGIVDERALARALKAGKLRAAGLDVFETEPVETANPLLGLNNIVLSPHMAGLSYESAERMSVMAARNCLAGLRGELEAHLVVNASVLAS